MQPRFCYYRLALRPKEVERIEADRPWSSLAMELSEKYNLNKQKEGHKTSERKVPQAFLVQDFSEYPNKDSTELAPEYLLKPGDKLHIKLIPCSLAAPAYRATLPPAPWTVGSTEEERIHQLCSMSHSSQLHRHTHRQFKRPYDKRLSEPIKKATGIPKSMQQQYLKQTYK